MKSRSGFTLIELSIVLVVIGLITGGILIGRDLIHAAEIRATVKQVEQFDAAINAFHLKFNCLPGDCNNPAAFGFTDMQSTNGIHGAPVAGNGDDMISDDPNNGVDGNEVEEAWWWLQEAGLITGVNVGDTSNIANGPTAYSVIPAIIGNPQSFSSGGWSLGYATWNVLYVAIGIDVDVPGNPATTNPFFLESAHYYILSSDIKASYRPTAIPPVDAFAIDNKLDDGLPRSGRVLASGNNTYDYSGSWPLPLSDPTGMFGTPDEGLAGANSPYCVTSQIPPQFNVQNTNGETDQSETAVGPHCVLAVKASF